MFNSVRFKRASAKSSQEALKLLCTIDKTPAFPPKETLPRVFTQAFLLKKPLDEFTKPAHNSPACSIEEAEAYLSLVGPFSDYMIAQSLRKFRMYRPYEFCTTSFKLAIERLAVGDLFARTLFSITSKDDDYANALSFAKRKKNIMILERRFNKLYPKNSHPYQFRKSRAFLNPEESAAPLYSALLQNYAERYYSSYYNDDITVDEAEETFVSLITEVNPIFYDKFSVLSSLQFPINIARNLNIDRLIKEHAPHLAEIDHLESSSLKIKRSIESEDESSLESEVDLTESEQENEQEQDDETLADSKLSKGSSTKKIIKKEKPIKKSAYKKLPWEPQEGLRKQMKHVDNYNAINPIKIPAVPAFLLCYIYKLGRIFPELSHTKVDTMEPEQLYAINNLTGFGLFPIRVRTLLKSIEPQLVHRPSINDLTTSALMRLSFGSTLESVMQALTLRATKENLDNNEIKIPMSSGTQIQNPSDFPFLATIDVPLNYKFNLVDERAFRVAEVYKFKNGMYPWEKREAAQKKKLEQQSELTSYSNEEQEALNKKKRQDEIRRANAVFDAIVAQGDTTEEDSLINVPSNAENSATDENNAEINSEKF